MSTWAPLPAGTRFGLEHLPYGVATDPAGHPQVVTRIGDSVLAVADAVPEHHQDLFRHATLDGFLAAGPSVWRETRDRLREHLSDPAADRDLPSAGDVDLRLPWSVGDYVDFYASLDHATTLGRILRPDSPGLPASWRHLPIGYHGRSGTVAVSGTPVIRPSGLVADEGPPRRRPTRQLDFELEVGFVVGPGSRPGRPIAVDEAAEHVFGVVLVNDWSARDIQAFEYQPLGPFLGKSFLTTVSPWVTPLDALDGALVAGPTQEPTPDPWLRTERPWGLDLDLTVELNGTPVCHTSFASTYWTFAQQLAHLTSNGATVRPGDLFASGTVSGPEAGQRGCLMEATWRGTEPLALDDGTTRAWLLDGDTVTLSGTTGHEAGPVVGLAPAVGTVVASHRPRRRDDPPTRGANR